MTLRRLLPIVLSTVTLGVACGAASALDPDAIKAAADRIDAKRIGDAVAELASPDMNGRREGGDGATRAVLAIDRAFADCGLEKLPGEGSFVVTEDGHRNVIGLVRGTDRTGEAVVLSAHWDGIGADADGKLVPGADENASGVSALIESARALAKTKPRRSLLFAAFGGWWDAKEESPRFHGARAFLKKAATEKEWPRPVFQVGLMSLGVPLLPAQPEHFFVLGAESSDAGGSIAKELATASKELKPARASIELIEKRGPRDDYDAFRSSEVPFVFLTSGVSKHYHKPGDVPSSVDPKRIAAAARLAIETIARVDALDQAPVFTKDHPCDRADAKQVLELMDAALDEKSGIVMTPIQKRALLSKREKVKDVIAGKGELNARERQNLKDSLELLLLLLVS